MKKLWRSFIYQFKDNRQFDIAGIQKITLNDAISKSWSSFLFQNSKVLIFYVLQNFLIEVFWIFEINLMPSIWNHRHRGWFTKMYQKIFDSFRAYPASRAKEKMHFDICWKMFSPLKTLVKIVWGQSSNVVTESIEQELLLTRKHFSSKFIFLWNKAAGE